MLVSVVVPSYNEESNVEELFRAVSKVLKGTDFEILFVNDGSSDGTLDTLRTMSSVNKKVKYISFSRNFGHQAALRAGIAHARGDAVISMDADLQHPPQLIPTLLEEWRHGNDIVYTVRNDTKATPFLKRFTSALFYKIINYLADLNIDKGAADFRLIDRKVVDVINSQAESDLFLRGYIDWIGFRQKAVSYVPAERFSGTSKYNLKNMLKLAGAGVTQFSIKPLRVAFSFAWIAIGLSVVYAIYAIVVASFGRTVSGWLSIVVLLIFFQGMQFLLLGVIGEYLGRTFIQTKNRPEYIISEKNIDL